MWAVATSHVRIIVVKAGTCGCRGGASAVPLQRALHRMRSAAKYPCRVLLGRDVHFGLHARPQNPFTFLHSRGCQLFQFGNHCNRAGEFVSSVCQPAGYFMIAREHARRERERASKLQAEGGSHRARAKATFCRRIQRQHRPIGTGRRGQECVPVYRKAFRSNRRKRMLCQMGFPPSANWTSI